MEGDARVPTEGADVADPHESAELESLLTEVVSEGGLELDSVLELTQDGSHVVRVVVDAPEGRTGVDSDTLADVSRAVSKALDVADPIPGEYLLEVSTPGAERELRRPGHWRRAVGHLVRVKLRDGTRVEGRLRAVEEDGAVVEVDGEPTTIPFAQVKRARPRVEFGSEE